MSRAVLAIALLGCACHRAIIPARDAAPPPEAPTVFTLELTAPRRSMDEVDRLLLLPVEAALRGTPGLQHLDGVALDGRATLRATFASGTAMDAALNGVVAPLRDLRLPLGDCSARGTWSSLHAARFALTAGDVSLDDLRAWAELHLEPALASVHGVDRVTVCGGADRDVGIALEPALLWAQHIPLAAAIAALRALPDLAGVDALGEVAVAAGVRLRDVARVAVEDGAPSCWVTGKDGAPFVEVTVMLDEDVAVDALNPRLEAARQQLPPTARLEREPEPALVMSFTVTRVERREVERKLGIGKQPSDAVSARVDRSATASTLPDELEVRFAAAGDVDAMVDQINAGAARLGVSAGRRRDASELHLVLTGTDLDGLRATATRIRTAAAGLAGVKAAGARGVLMDSENVFQLSPEAAKRGVSQAAVDEASALFAWGGGERLREVNVDGRALALVMHLGHGEHGAIDPRELTVVANDGKLVQLDAVTTPAMRVVPFAILSHDGQHAVEVWLRVAPGTDRDALRKSLGAVTPPGVTLEWVK